MQQKRDPASAAIVVGLVGVVLTIGLYAPFGPPAATEAAALPQPTQDLVRAVLVSTPYATEPPAPTAAPLPPAARLSAPATAYSAPDGAVIGPIEAGRPYRVLARSGPGWAQIDAAGSGAVWVRADATLDLASAPDLATPVPAPTSAPAAPQAPPQVVVVYQDVAPAPVAPAPAQPAEAPAPVGCPPNCHRPNDDPPAIDGGHPEAAPQPSGGAPHASFGTRSNDGAGTSPSDPVQLHSGIMLRTATP